MRNMTRCQAKWVVLTMCLLGGLVFQGTHDDVWGLASGKKDMPSEPIILLNTVVSTGLEHPTFLTQPQDETSQLFVVEQPGRIRILEGGIVQQTPFLNISDRVLSGGERGLLGLAFHPEYKNNGRLFVNYTRAGDGATVIAEYRRSANHAKFLSTERILLLVEQPFSNHNGGMLAFGPDGFLYVGMGDGGSGGDPGNRAQNFYTLLGKMLRLNVDGPQPYGVPKDNPFVSTKGRGEIFAVGLRNPWRFSFDMHTGMLWAGDVGQGEWEEIDIVQLGRNYGWRSMEGSHCFHPKKGCVQQGVELPIAEYRHHAGRCSVTGGYVYRGKKVPGLTGRYIFGDFCTGEIFALPHDAEKNENELSDISILLKTDLNIASFGQDRQGEVYVLDLAGGIYTIVQKPLLLEGTKVLPLDFSNAPIDGYPD